MPEPTQSPDRLSSNRFFWAGLFASPILSCILFSSESLFKGSGALATVLGFSLVITTLAGAFYCGFLIAWRCARNTGSRVVLGLIFSFGFLVLDFAVFFIGCCAALSMH